MRLFSTQGNISLQEDENLVFHEIQDGVGDFLFIEEALVAGLVVWLPARFCRVVFAPGCTQLTWGNEWYQVDILSYPIGATHEWLIDYLGRRKYLSVYHGQPGSENAFPTGWRQERVENLTPSDFECFSGVHAERALVAWRGNR